MAGLERKKIEDELKAIQALIKDLKDILKNPLRLLTIIKDELGEIKEKFGYLVKNPNFKNITIYINEAVKEMKRKEHLINDFVENLIRGNSFYIQFSNIQTQGISLEIMNSMGNKVFRKENLINQRAPQHITIESLNSGIYFVKIYANNKVYVQRVFITNN